MNRATVLTVITVLLAICLPAQAAITATWDGDTSNLWTNGLNWVGGVAPVTGDSVVFNALTPNMPTDFGGAGAATGTLAKITVSAGSWTFGQTGQTLNIANASTPLLVTSGGSTITFNCSFTAPSSGSRTIEARNSTIVFNQAVSLTSSGQTVVTYFGTGNNMNGTFVFNAPVNTFAASGSPSAGGVTGTSNAGSMSFFQLGTDSFLSTGGILLVGTNRNLTVYADNIDRILAVASNIMLSGGSTLHFGDATNTYAGALNVTCLIKEANGEVGGIDKAGNSVLKLSYATGNTYTQGTTVLGGTLLAANTSGSATGTGFVWVKNGAKLGGGGYITGATTVDSGGHLTPGQSIGTLHLGSVNFQGGAVLDLEYDETTSDLVDATSLFFGATATLNLTWVGAGDGPTADLDRVLFNFGGSAPTNPTWTINGLPTGATGEVTIQGSQVILHLTTATVPEPATLALLALGGLMATGGALRRRKAVS